MSKSVFNTIFDFIRTYLTYILIFIVFIINYYMLFQMTNLKDNEKKLSLEKYLFKSLQIQYVPIVIIIFIILPLIIYMVYKLSTKKEDVRIVELVFVYSLISGLYNFSKSIIIIYNNYYKAQIVSYGYESDISSRINVIYKSLINDDEYSNIDIFYKIWSGPIIFAISMSIFGIITTTIFNNKSDDSNTKALLANYFFNKDKISYDTITIGDIIYFVSVIIGFYKNYFGLTTFDIPTFIKFMNENPDIVKKYNLEGLNKLIALINV